MDYEQKHQEDLEAAKGWLAIAKENDNKIAIQILEKFFPELKESEDERIRKEIISHFKDFYGFPKLGEFPKEKILAWLEKQGEQKPTDEVEPKFKVGDWVVQDNIGVFKIIEICESWYEVIDFEDNHYSISFDNEHMCHLWTIQDAKEGDVLAYDTIVLIVDHLETFENRPIIYSWYFADSNKFYGIGTSKPDRWEVEGFTPATKEQHDFLFQKMKEAGYKWDAEKKELKKIEQSCYHNDGLYYAIDILEKTLGKVEGYQSDDGIIEHQKAIETVNALYHKKPAEWNEEDKSMYIRTLGILGKCYMGELPTKVEEELKWLKSIKDRVQPQPQPKQEWSEEDENIRKQLIKHCSGPHELYDERNWNKWLNWLKSLKPHWKPSEEQILSLQEAISIVGENSISGRNLIEILKNLKTFEL